MTAVKTAKEGQPYVEVRFQAHLLGLMIDLSTVLLTQPSSGLMYSMV